MFGEARGVAPEGDRRAVASEGLRQAIGRDVRRRDIPRIVIPPDRIDEALNRPVLPTASSQLGRCSYPLSTLEASRVHDLLTEAARLELDKRQEYNDPPTYPRMLYGVLGEKYLEYGSPRLAVDAFQKALDEVPNDAFALAGLTRAHHALDDIGTASGYYGRLLHVWSDSDEGLRWLDEARALGLHSKPTDESAHRLSAIFTSETMARLLKHHQLMDDVLLFKRVTDQVAMLDGYQFIFGAREEQCRWIVRSDMH